MLKVKRIIFGSLKIKYYIFGFLVFPALACAGTYFEPSLIESINGTSPKIDLSYFNDSKQLPGEYRVKIIINTELFEQRVVKFINNEKEGLVPCFTKEEYNSFGVDFGASYVNKKVLTDAHSCASVQSVINGASTRTDFSKLELNISIPQVSLLEVAKDDVPERYWDEGITAFISNYRFDGSLQNQNENRNPLIQGETEGFLDWRNGFNTGAWRFRNDSSWSNEGGWQSLSTYAERSIHVLKSELTIGDFSTSQSVFDSVPLRGVRLATDNDMLPNSLNGFAPIIRGIAKSYAQVTIKDNSNIIYQKNVPPGAFEFNNIAPVSEGGTLEVTIKESDGSETKYNVPFATVPILQRAGQLNYSLTMGKYDSGSDDKNHDIAENSIAYGLPYNLTLIGGGQLSDNYSATSFGLGIDAEILGGFSVVAIHDKATPTLNKDKLSGYALHLNYAKKLQSTLTDIQIDAKFFKKNYLSFSDTQDRERMESPPTSEQSVSINQPVGDSGKSLFFTVAQTQYDDSADRVYQAGFNGSLKYLSYSMAVSATRNADEEKWDRQITINFSLPFSAFLPSESDHQRGTTSYMLTNDSSGATSQQLSLNDALDDDDTLNYTTSIGYENSGRGTSAAINLDNKGSSGEGYIGYDYDSQQQKITYGLTGGILIHKDDVTLNQYFENSAALVSVPGGKNIKIANSTGVSTNRNGYAVLPDISPYQRNDIDLIIPSEGMESLGIPNISENAVPTKDAIVMVKFKTNIGRKVLVSLHGKQSNLPFGSQVSIDKKSDVFYVSENGIVYLTGVPDKGILTVKINEGETCTAPFSLPIQKINEKTPMDRLSLLCQ